MSSMMNRKKWKDILNLLKRGIRHLFLHNGWVKLLAVLISIALWAGLISQDPNVIRNKTFQNVEIDIRGADTLQRRGRIVTNDLDELLTGVSMTAAVPQLQYEDADTSRYNLRVDLSSIRNTGEQEIRIVGDNSSVYGDVISINPSTITVNVEEYFTNPKVPITIRTEGDAPEGWYVTKPSVAPTTVLVSGPISIVKEVSRGFVTLDLSQQSWEEGTIRATGEIKLRNTKGEEINSPLLSISSEGNANDSVIIDAKMLPTREYNLREMVQIKGEPAEGYLITGEPQFSTETITIAGSENTLKELDELSPLQRGNKIFESQTLDISGLSETKDFILELKIAAFDDSKAAQSDVVQPGVIQPASRTVNITVAIEAAETVQAEDTESESADNQKPPVTEP